MEFFVNSLPPPQIEPLFILNKDGWNDWFIWRTLYSATVLLPSGSRIVLGGVKIGKQGMSDENASTELPSKFSTLDRSYFSVGLNENYYETLLSLGDDVRVKYLEAIRDCAFSLEVFESNRSEPVMSGSLLRDIDVSRVKERFHRLAHNSRMLTPYSFKYQFPTHQGALTPEPTLRFDVQPENLPATNIHVLIGRNGVGKTRCLDHLARSFLKLPSEGVDQSVGLLRGIEKARFKPDKEVDDVGFAGLVTVSFSAFDSKGPFKPEREGEKRYAYIGLVTTGEEKENEKSAEAKPLRIKTSIELANEFGRSVLVCREGVRLGRWRKALEALEADPLFAEANVAHLAEEGVQNVELLARDLFRRMSSGHAAILLSITRLVELVEEKSLVLIDEPEGHLHPPLLSAFIRALSDLLINRNGVAIIATHSPVVLQEVPSSCVWKLNRAGLEVRADRPELETFGENVGILTREVFSLEVTQTGFHKLIAELAQDGSYEEIVAKFKGQLGAEARSLARALSLASPPKPEPEHGED